nr:hypothetical protein [Candidatus Woesearchaeota archaeon]
MATKFSDRSMFGRQVARISGWSKKRGLKIKADEANYIANRNYKEEKLKEYTERIENARYHHKDIPEDDSRRYEIENAYLSSLKNSLEKYNHGKLTLSQLKSADKKAQNHYLLSIKKWKEELKKRSDLEKRATKHSIKAMEHQTEATKHHLESRLEQIAAVVLIVIGASIILSTNATITTYSVIPEYKDQGRFFIVGILLIALGIFFPSLAFIKNLIKKGKNKNSIVNKKKKKSKK